MPRKPRIEYPGAVYHVMSRGNHRQKVFREDNDCVLFLETLGEVCRRTGWKIHAYALMGNHYHMLLETPEPNLVVGMQWFQSTYTKRFNAIHREWGHLFQGRYKAIPVEAGTGYFSTIATYIHLNPVRIKGFDFTKERLDEYRWSSYPAYIRQVDRPEWLACRRVLEQLGIPDSAKGCRAYADYIAARIEEVRHSDQPWKADAQWQKIRRGWQFGSEEFRKEILKQVDISLKKARRSSFSGNGICEHDEATAEKWIAEGMKHLAIQENDLKHLRMSSPEKVALAWLVRRNTSVRPTWIKKRLGMGTATCFAAYLKKLEGAKPGKWGYSAWHKVENIKL